MEKRDETSEDTAIKAPFAEPRIGPSLAQADIASATGAPETGRVSSLKGTAQVTGGDGISRPLGEGDPVHQGDRVPTWLKKPCQRASASGQG